MPETEKALTFRALRDQLMTFSDEQLEATIVVYNSRMDEYYPAKSAFDGRHLPVFIHDAGNEKDGDVLDDGHPFLYI